MFYKCEGLKRGETLSAVDWLNRGHSYAEAMSFDAAISCFDKALEINPGFIRAWINKGQSLEDLGKFEEAVNCYDKNKSAT